MFEKYSWKSNVEEETRLEDLQNKIRNNEIQEDDLMQEDREKLVMLYSKQNDYLRKRLKMYKQEISRLLKI